MKRVLIGAVAVGAAAYLGVRAYVARMDFATPFTRALRGD